MYGKDQFTLLKPKCPTFQKWPQRHVNFVWLWPGDTNETEVTHFSKVTPKPCQNFLCEFLLFSRTCAIYFIICPNINKIYCTPILGPNSIILYLFLSCLMIHVQLKKVLKVTHFSKKSSIVITGEKGKLLKH